MKRVQFVAAVLCVLVAAGLAIDAISRGHWVWFAIFGLALVACFVWAFIVAVRTFPPLGKA